MDLPNSALDVEALSELLVEPSYGRTWRATRRHRYGAHRRLQPKAITVSDDPNGDVLRTGLERDDDDVTKGDLVDKCPYLARCLTDSSVVAVVERLGRPCSVRFTAAASSKSDRRSARPAAPLAGLGRFPAWRFVWRTRPVRRQRLGAAGLDDHEQARASGRVGQPAGWSAQRSSTPPHTQWALVWADARADTYANA